MEKEMFRKNRNTPKQENQEERKDADISKRNHEP